MSPCCKQLWLTGLLVLLRKRKSAVTFFSVHEPALQVARDSTTNLRISVISGLGRFDIQAVVVHFVCSNVFG